MQQCISHLIPGASWTIPGGWPTAIGRGPGGLAQGIDCVPRLEGDDQGPLIDPWGLEPRHYPLPYADPPPRCGGRQRCTSRNRQHFAAQDIYSRSRVYSSDSQTGICSVDIGWAATFGPRMDLGAHSLRFELWDHAMRRLHIHKVPRLSMMPFVSGQGTLP